MTPGTQAPNGEAAAKEAVGNVGASSSGPPHPRSYGQSTTDRFAFQAVGAIILILLVQSYWLVGTTNLKDIDRYETELLDITQQRSTLEKVVADSGEEGAGDPLLEPLLFRLNATIPRLESAQSAIETWNHAWSWMIFWGKADSERSSAPIEPLLQVPDLSRQRLEQRNAAATTSILGLYVLPLLYGWLGATLRGLRRLVDLDEISQNVMHQARIRIGMGAVAGPIIGLFMSPDVLSSLPAQTAPFALAFIAGYATDVFFSMLDRFADSMKVPPTPPNPPHQAERP
jgi:hypothetical protein